MTNTTNIPDAQLVDSLLGTAHHLADMVDAVDNEIYRLQAELANARVVAERRRIEADMAYAEVGSLYTYSVTLDTVNDREEYVGLNIAEVGALLARRDYNDVAVQNDTIGRSEEEHPSVWAAARLHRASHVIPMFNVAEPQDSFAARRMFGRG